MLPGQRIIHSGSSEELELFGLRGKVFLRTPPEIEDVPVLAVSDGKYTDLAFVANQGFYPTYVNFCAFLAGAMARVYGILHHRESVLDKLLPEACGELPVFLRENG